MKQIQLQMKLVNVFVISTWVLEYIYIQNRYYDYDMEITYTLETLGNGSLCPQTSTSLTPPALKKRQPPATSFSSSSKVKAAPKKIWDCSDVFGPFSMGFASFVA